MFLKRIGHISLSPSWLDLLASSAHCFPFLFSKEPFTGKAKIFPRSLWLHVDCMPISMTLAGGSWLGLEPPVGGLGSPCPSCVPPCQPSWAMGDQTTPILLGRVQLLLGTGRNGAASPTALRYQRFTGGWGLPSIAPGDAPALQVYPQPGSHGTAACCTPAASLAPSGAHGILVASPGTPVSS